MDREVTLVEEAPEARVLDPLVVLPPDAFGQVELPGGGLTGRLDEEEHLADAGGPERPALVRDASTEPSDTSSTRIDHSHGAKIRELHAPRLQTCRRIRSAGPRGQPRVWTCRHRARQSALGALAAPPALCPPDCRPRLRRGRGSCRLHVTGHFAGCWESDTGCDMTRDMTPHRLPAPTSCTDRGGWLGG